MNKEMIEKQIELLQKLINKSLEEQGEMELSLKFKKESIKEMQDQVTSLIKELMK